jgi:hypothetical protein
MEMMDAMPMQVQGFGNQNQLFGNFEDDMMMEQRALQMEEIGFQEMDKT